LRNPALTSKQTITPMKK